MSLSLDGWRLFPRAASFCLCLIIFICIVMKIIFSPFSLTVLQDGIFVGSCVMSLSDRALETQRLLLLLFHLQDTKHQSCVEGLSRGSPEVSKYNFGACLACWDLRVGGWRSEKYETLHNVRVKTEYPVFLDSFNHSFKKHFLSAYYAPSIVIDNVLALEHQIQRLNGEQKRQKFLPLWSLHSGRERQSKNTEEYLRKVRTSLQCRPTQRHNFITH